MNKLLGTTALAIVLGATAAVAQTTAPTSPPVEKMSPPASSTTTVTKDGLVLTEAQATAWVKKAVYSSDGKNVGEVTETQVRVMPAQFKLENDRVVLSLTAEQVKTLPKIVK